jgi:hypothetical protein
MSKKTEPNPINIELPEELEDGIYANLAMIAHSPSEFIIDFISIMPGMAKAKVKSRIIVSPEHAKRLLAALEDNIEKYERNFGSIKSTENDFGMNLNFGGPVGEA